MQFIKSKIEYGIAVEFFWFFGGKWRRELNECGDVGVLIFFFTIIYKGTK